MTLEASSYYLDIVNVMQHSHLFSQ